MKGIPSTNASISSHYHARAGKTLNKSPTRIPTFTVAESDLRMDGTDPKDAGYVLLVSVNDVQL